MGKFIRDNQLDKYTGYEEEGVIRSNKKKKTKKFKDPDEQKDKLIKRN